MSIYSGTTISGDLNLSYIHKHKRMFDIEKGIYPLELFEDFVSQVEGWGLECSCKIEKDRIHPIRFNVYYNKPSLKQYQLAHSFLRQVESRADVKLDLKLLKAFVGDYFDFSKVGQILLGTDLRRELSSSRLKFWFVFSNYPEKIITAAILSGQKPPKALQGLIFDNTVIVGFDFFLDGRSAVELYSNITDQNLYEASTQMQLKNFLSAPALQLVDNCQSLMFGFSNANPENILYYRTHDPDNFISRLHNDLASRVHASYQEEPVKGVIVGLREKEFLTGLVENINLYYQVSECG